MTPQERHHNTFLVQRFVQHARRLSEEGKYDEALRALTQAYSIDPFDPSALALEEEIMLRQRSLSSSASDKPEETAPPLSGKTASRIAEHIAKAYQFQKKRDFGNALHEIAEALVLDPLNELLHQLEREIYVEYKKHQKDHHRQKGVVIHTPEDHRDKPEPPSIPPPPLQQAQPETRQTPTRAEENSNTVPSIQGNGTGQQPRQAEDEYYERARSLFNQQAYEEALSEIALGLLLNEHSEKLRILEAEIWNSIEDSARQTSNEPSQTQESALKEYLRSAEEYLKAHEFDHALDELTNVYMIDPLNPEANKLEERIRQKQMKQSS